MRQPSNSDADRPNALSINEFSDDRRLLEPEAPAGFGPADNGFAIRDKPAESAGKEHVSVLLAECTARVIDVQAEGDWLASDGPEAALTADLLARLQKHNADLPAIGQIQPGQFMSQSQSQETTQPIAPSCCR